MTVMMVLCIDNGSRNESVAQFLLNATKLQFVARVPENVVGLRAAGWQMQVWHHGLIVMNIQSDFD